ARTRTSRGILGWTLRSANYCLRRSWWFNWSVNPGSLSVERRQLGPTCARIASRTHLCALHVPCHFSQLNRWQESPTRKQKMAVLYESRVDRMTIHGASAPVVQQLLWVNPLLVPDSKALALYRRFKDDTLHRIDGCVRLPHRGRRVAVQAARVAGIGDGLGGCQVSERPLTTAAVRVRLILGPLFQRTNRRFNGPIITGTRRRRVQRNYSRGL